MRWKPARAGILNVWEYDDQTFDFGDGRLVLRGRNGSGKSNALSLLFPFLLDGVMSAARMDPMGGARSMKSLLLGRDDTEGGGYQHDSGTGYVWMEFERGDESCTVGAGAAATVHRDADVWFFVTSERVGDGLELTAGDVPLARRQLAERLGNASVFNTAEDYRQAVDHHLLGLGTPRYRSLVDLLLTLRRPHLAGKLDTEHLSATLSAGLRELDASLIDDVAHSFDDLDAMQQELEGLTASLDAVERFLPVYREHLITAARSRAEAVVSTADEQRRVERDQRSASTQLDTARTSEAVAAGQLTAALNTKTEIETRIAAIQASDAYKSAAALDEVRASAERATRRSKESAERADASAAQAAAAEHRLDAARETLRGRESERDRAVREWNELAAAAGIQSVLPPDSFDHDRAVTLVAERRTELQRIQELAESSARAATSVDLALRAVDVSRQRAEAAERERARAAEAVERERAALTEQWAAWWGDVLALVERIRTETGPLNVSSPDEVPGAEHFDAVEPAETAQRDEDLEDDDVARFRRADSWLGDIDTEMALAVQRAADAVTEQQERLSSLADERRQVAEEPNPGPPLKATRPDGADDQVPGAPLYMCVDFAEGLDEAARAGLESALDAAGLLDARIAPDGLALDSLDAALLPRQVTPAECPTLADVLVPTTTAGLDAAHISAVLQAIPLDSDVVQLGRDGRWRLGPLAGRYLHNEARYIGHAARERRRAERLVVLDGQIGEAEAELTEREAGAATCKERRARLGDLRTHQPPTAPLLSALVEHRRRYDLAAQAADLHADAVTAADEAASAAEAASTELHRHAVAVRLPTGVVELNEVGQLLFRVELQRQEVAAAEQACSDASQRLRELNEAFDDATERSQTDAAAAASDEGHARDEQARFQQLHLTVGADAKVAVDQLAAAREELVDARGQHQTASEQQRDAELAIAKLEKHLEDLAGRQETAELVATAAVEAFQVICAPEIAEVLDIHGVEPGAGELDAARLVVSETPAPADDATNRMERAHREILLDGLRAGHDPSMPKVDGIDVVRVGTADGELPIGTLARQLRDEHDRTAQLLSKQEREIFETHLLTRIGESLRALLLEADEFQHRINAEMADAPTESGMVVELKWEIASDEAGLADAVRALRTAPEMLGPERREGLREFFMRRIADLRASDPGRSFAETLTNALDYRSWHGFTLFARFSDGSRQKVTRKFYKGLSGGEAASLLHLPLFAAAAAQYSAGAVDGPRLIALDEAFVGIDDQMRARLMGLLTQLDLDVLLTSHEFWGFYDTVPALVLYDLTRRPPLPGVHAQRFDWTAGIDDDPAEHL
jgi:uncharacterized protein (TIGR02680 family)